MSWVSVACFTSLAQMEYDHLKGLTPQQREDYFRRKEESKAKAERERWEKRPYSERAKIESDYHLQQSLGGLYHEVMRPDYFTEREVEENRKFIEPETPTYDPTTESTFDSTDTFNSDC